MVYMKQNMLDELIYGKEWVIVKKRSPWSGLVASDSVSID